MGRLALRPALRAYAHGQPLAEEAAFPNTESVLFDGISDSYVSDAAVVRPSATARSVSWWMKPNSPAAGYDYFFDSLSIQVYHSHGVLKCGGYGFTPLTGPSAGSVWAHFVFAVTSLGHKFLYKDGVEVASDEVNDGNHTATAAIGIGSSRAGAVPWPGNLDEVCFWEGTALSEANAVEIYNDGSALDMTAFTGTAPTNWWRMGDDAGDSGGESGVLVDQMPAGLDFSRYAGSPTVESDVPS